ncbi:MAG: hypothetical protein RIG62_20255 [Cyclobacteriaceae bacterium]
MAGSSTRGQSPSGFFVLSPEIALIFLEKGGEKKKKGAQLFEKGGEKLEKPSRVFEKPFPTPLINAPHNKTTYFPIPLPLVRVGS